MCDLPVRYSENIDRNSRACVLTLICCKVTEIQVFYFRDIYIKSCAYRRSKFVIRIKCQLSWFVVKDKKTTFSKLELVIIIFSMKYNNIHAFKCITPFMMYTYFNTIMFYFTVSDTLLQFV